jgi:2-C-methyl-D-erythritol 4-phosphate cytidylyltransferase
MPSEVTSRAGLGVVVVAAGKSSRMGGLDKIFAPVLGRPLVAYSLARFETFAPATQVALVLDEGSMERGQALVRQAGYRKVVRVCPGGLRRQDSVRSGLESMDHCDLVVIHDGARPCLDHSILSRGLAAAQEWGAAVAGVPVKDTIKVATSEGLVRKTPERETLWAAQTPQIFRYSLLWDAHQHCHGAFTDDAAMVESLGHPVKMFLGSYENLKVTTPGDLVAAEAFLREILKLPLPKGGRIVE